MEKIKSKIRTIPHFPIQGVMFRDIFSLLKDPQGLRTVIDEFVQRYTGEDIDFIVGLESRGFILGGAIAHQLGKGFVPIRKKGKLPGKTISHDYELEYGKDTIEIHADDIKPGSKVLIVDDLIATGGTAIAAATLLKKLNANIVEVTAIIDLPDLGGSKKLKELGHKVYAMCEFEGD